MDVEVVGSKKKSVSSMLKKLERYLTMKKRKKSATRSKSWSSSTAPVGCLSVYVGPEKQRFVIKTELVNHPLFKKLLEDAELEYGFKCDGPLLLPCHVDLFYRVLAEMECDDDEFEGQSPCSFSPARRRLGGTSYGLLRPVRSLKANNSYF